MITDYLIWQYTLGPLWLVKLSWNIQRALFHYFSLSIMLRTLFSHWHRDAVSYRLAGIGSIVLAFAWNTISRAIGFCIRITVIALWGLLALCVAAASLLGLLLFVMWPLITVLLFGVALFLMQQGI